VWSIREIAPGMSLDLTLQWWSGHLSRLQTLQLPKPPCEFYKDDINPDDLRSQLVIFGNSFQSISEKPALPTIFDIKEYFVKLSTAQKDLLVQVGLLLKLILVMPATNATSECSFSALR